MCFGGLEMYGRETPLVSKIAFILSSCEEAFLIKHWSEVSCES